MNTEARDLRDQELAFFGRIGADVSHDMRNVLSLVGEYAGLMDDLLAASTRRAAADPPRLRDLAGKIAQQVQRGTEILGRLSQFAHATDRPVASFDLSALVENITGLAQRRVRLANGRLDVELAEEAIPVRTSAFALQHAVYAAIMLILDSVPGGEPIKLKVQRHARSAAVHVAGRTDGDRTAGAEEFQRLCASLADLNLSVATSWDDGVLSCRLEIPTT